MPSILKHKKFRGLTQVGANKNAAFRNKDERGDKNDNRQSCVLLGTIIEITARSAATAFF